MESRTTTIYLMDWIKMFNWMALPVCEGKNYNLFQVRLRSFKQSEFPTFSSETNYPMFHFSKPSFFILSTFVSAWCDHYNSPRLPVLFSLFFVVPVLLSICSDLSSRLLTALLRFTCLCSVLLFSFKILTIMALHSFLP